MSSITLTKPVEVKSDYGMPTADQTRAQTAQPIYVVLDRIKYMMERAKATGYKAMYLLPQHIRICNEHELIAVLESLHYQVYRHEWVSPVGGGEIAYHLILNWGDKVDPALYRAKVLSIWSRLLPWGNGMCESPMPDRHKDYACYSNIQF